MRKAWASALALLLAGAWEAGAQVARGNLYGTVSDESGANLAGAIVTLSGGFGTRSMTTGETGEFRFLNLDHGTYTVTASLPGFTKLSREVIVATGANVDVQFRLKVAAVEEVVTVMGESPIVDTKKLGTNTTIGKDELANIPSSRDPWAIMRTIPGLLVDRVNIAGSESGQQSIYIGKGAQLKDNTWSFDGVVITDMATAGASPTYFSFDSFDEVNFSTAANDIKVATGGVGASFVTKRGTNSFHGGLNGYFTHNALQSSNAPAEVLADPRLQGNDKADHTEQISDYSFELGGPIVRDRLWFYGNYGKNDIRIRLLNQNRDKTVLKSYTAKLNWQASDNDMVSLFWFVGDKIKIGRVASDLPEAPGHAANQGNVFPYEPRGLTKLEWNRVFSPSFFLNLKAASYSSGFSLTPQAGLGAGQEEIRDIVNNIARGSSTESLFERPQYSLYLDGNYFATSFGGNHEVKFGVSWRKNPISTQTTYPGEGWTATINAGATPWTVQHRRGALTKSHAEFYSVYLSDMFTKDRLSVHLGARFDRQVGRNEPGEAPANPVIPDLLPAAVFDGNAPTIEWNDFSPRLGLTYALDASRKTVARASFAMYAGQLQSGTVQQVNPTSTASITWNWVDSNRDGRPQLNERVGAPRPSGVDLANPTSLRSPNFIADDFKANHDTEVVVGVDRELFANLAASAAYTWRRGNDLAWSHRRGITSADYVQGTPVTRSGFTATPWVVRPGLTAAQFPGFILENRPDFAQLFTGVELGLVKRMSNKWMGRVAFAWNDNTEEIDSPAAFINPTATAADPKIDGGQRVLTSTASGKSYYINAKWQFTLNGLYQLPGGFDIAASLFGRQGYPNPLTITVPTGAVDGNISALAVPEVDNVRLPNLWNLDVRLAKNIRFGRSSVTLSAEGFNVLNKATVLARTPAVNSTFFDRIDEIQAPRIVRFGLRYTF